MKMPKFSNLLIKTIGVAVQDDIYTSSSSSCNNRILVSKIDSDHTHGETVVILIDLGRITGSLKNEKKREEIEGKKLEKGEPTKLGFIHIGLVYDQ